MDCSALELCCILVHTAQNAPETRLSTLLAAWLHWYGRLDMEQAVEVRPPPPLLPKVTLSGYGQG